MILETNRLILRPWEISDAEDLYKYAKEPEIGLQSGWMPHKSVNESRRVLREILMVPNTFAVFHKENEEVIGSIGLLLPEKNHIDLRRDEAELGFWIGKPYWGQGLMSEAIEEVLGYAFEKMGVQKVWCVYFDGNEPSYRVQKKCGFLYQRTESDTEWLVGKRITHIASLSVSRWKWRKSYRC